ncbi:WxcM-like domain-containing protein [Muricoccus pecuniae]|uniref:Acetyltransferase-like isoleucine patch superfamily enzyme n=1 Tax=Muricoccus pecuniae TaxID=693023 RepID=A0A840XZI4_9PROT|nr:WxcM-like domain-containing protein [Roseomonas pecuniae]MBB5694248.1 acetyltransferase-like isoleucine patch superfamily enzyme [Roseomonas pecuniae]
MSEPFIHPQALCESRTIGAGTRVWAFAHVLPGAVIGADNNICDGVFIENDVVTGDRVTIKCGVQLWDGLRVEDDVFIGPNATFTNDMFPRSRVQRDALPPTTLRRGCSIGANATILPGVTVGPGAMVGAGTVITADVPANAVVVGNPARIVGYAGAEEVILSEGLPPGAPCRLIRADTHRDPRGRLSHWPLEAALPFTPRRLYVIDGAPDGWARGGGAYRRSHQFLIVTQGAVTVAMDDGRSRHVLRLSGPDAGLHVPPGVWTLQYGHSTDAALLVLASELYNPGERVAEYLQFSLDFA